VEIVNKPNLYSLIFGEQKIADSTSALGMNKNGEELIFVIFYGERYGK